ncbi:ERF family protein [Brevibacillus migulae]|uniref:ERF family protein n=1 Tax=Brevibacillus migulae TaxID=1644114 RepID=UPI00106E8387|nr:ERF family protein [Brevibacillus migulae]
MFEQTSIEVDGIQYQIQQAYFPGWNDDHKIILKIAEVMETVKYIQKRGHNKFHNYKYATEADVNEKIREEIAKRKVIMIPSVLDHKTRDTKTKSGNTEYIVCTIMQFTFMDGETGERLVLMMRGEGQDVGDKAIYKAESGTQKYALMKLFMIPTGDDPEADEEADKRNAGQDDKGNRGNKKAQEEKPPTQIDPLTSEQIGNVNLKVQELIALGGTKEKIHESLFKVLNKEFHVVLRDLTEIPGKLYGDTIKILEGFIEMKKQPQSAAK